jgi:sarcosine oxidase subunit gamma
MDEALVSPLHDWRPHPLTGIRLGEIPYRAQVNLRLPAQAAAADAIGGELGVALPTSPGDVGRAGERSVLCLGPDEWLVLGPPGADLAARLRSRAGAGPASVVDVSAQCTTILVAGPGARDLLAHGCALDLHPSRFPGGRCAQTMLAHAQVILMAVEPPPIQAPLIESPATEPPPAELAYHVLVRSSFAWYLAQWLEDAAVEYR